MKNKIMIITCILFIICANVSASEDNKKILVAYFTQPVNRDNVDAVTSASMNQYKGNIVGNVGLVANWIADYTEVDLFRIEPKQPYPGNFNDLRSAVVSENERGIHPPIKSQIRNFNQYDVVFIGFPIYMYTIPSLILSFLDEYNLSGKTIIPFCVHGGSRWANSIEIIKEYEPKAKMEKGFAISRESVATSNRKVVSWLNSLDL